MEPWLRKGQLETGSGGKLVCYFDLAHMRAVGFDPKRAKGQISLFDWFFAFKVEDASNKPCTLHRASVILHGKTSDFAHSIDWATRFCDITTEDAFNTYTRNDFAEEMLPRLNFPMTIMPGQSSMIHAATIMQLFYREATGQLQLRSFAPEAVVEPGTYRNFYPYVTLELETNCGTVRIGANVPIFSGDLVNIGPRTR